MDSKQERSGESSRKIRSINETELEDILNMSQIPIEVDQNVEKHIGKLEDDLKEALNDIERKEKQIENFKKTQKSLEKIQQLHKKKIAELQQKIKSIEGGSRIQQARPQSRFKDNGLQNKIKSLEDNVDKLKKQLQTKEKENQILTSTLSEKQRKIADIENQKKKLNEIIKNCQEQFSREAKNTQRYQIELEKLQKKANEYKDNSKNVNTVIKTEIVIDKEATERLQKQKKILSNQITKYKNEITELKKQIENLEKSSKRLQSNLTESNKQKDSLKQKNKGLQQELRFLKQAQIQGSIQIQEQTSQLNIIEGQDQEAEVISPVEKEIKKSLQNMIRSKVFYNKGDRIRMLNILIVSAENELDLLTSQ